jgi:transcriptional regulator with XRE-family HTH domain
MNREKRLGKQIGKMIRQARLDADLSLRKLAKRVLSASHSEISRWERARSRIAVIGLIEIALALKRPLSYFMTACEEELLVVRSLDDANLEIRKDEGSCLELEIRAFRLLQAAVRAQQEGLAERATLCAARSNKLFETIGNSAGAASALIVLGDIAGLAEEDWTRAKRYYEDVESIKFVPPTVQS